MKLESQGQEEDAFYFIAQVVKCTNICLLSMYSIWLEQWILGCQGPIKAVELGMFRDREHVDKIFQDVTA